MTGCSFSRQTHISNWKSYASEIKHFFNLNLPISSLAMWYLSTYLLSELTQRVKGGYYMTKTYNKL